MKENARDSIRLQTGRARVQEDPKEDGKMNLLKRKRYRCMKTETQVDSWIHWRGKKETAGHYVITVAATVNSSQ